MTKKIVLTIEKLSPRGFGIGSFLHPHTNAPVNVEVSHTVVGDKVEVAVYSKRKSLRKGRVLQLIEPSKKRCETRCPHAQICGGCSLQQMDYTYQAEYKQTKVQKIFRNFPNALINPIIQCKDPWHYRNKMEFSFSENRAKTKFLGLMIAHAATYVFNVEKCFIAPPWMSKVLSHVRTWWENSSLLAYNHQENTGHLRTLVCRESFDTKEKIVMLTVSGDPEYALKKEDIKTFCDSVKKALTPENLSIFLRVQQVKKGSPTQMFEMHLFGPTTITEKISLSHSDLYFTISPSSFFQPNSKGAEMLYQKVVDLAQPAEEEVVFDLYAGTGTLGMAFAKIAKKVIAIELDAHSVCDAQENLHLNQITNMEIYQGDVGKILQNKSFPLADLVIVDPPRAGLDALALENICKLKPKKIIYVSCNPLTQERDCTYLTEQGYKIKILQPLDQFPHTYHIENIALLVREA